MTSDQWRQVRDLFEQAIERDPADLPGWLAQEAAGDTEVQREVRSLLAHHSHAGSFLAEPLRERVPDWLIDDDALGPGTKVGAYSIVREIGRGGMGRVYLASDTRLGRQVALKALPPHLTADEAQRERLRREARSAAALTHSGICTVYALEEIDGALFIAAEYIEGRTLKEEIASGQRPSAHEVVAVARELAAALASAHAKSITHRDLKPENVMRASDGRLKILDFGLATAGALSGGGPEDGSIARLTRPGFLMGTPAYMAPEQLNGQPADARSDVFSFGLLLYEYATGVHPFDAGTPLSMAARVLESAARPLGSVRPDVPPAIVTIVDRCLRKSPEERWPSAVDLALALAHPEGLQPPATRVNTWWRTHQVVIMGLYCVAATVAWQVKESVHGLADPAFVALGIMAAVGGVLRGHLVFTERMNPAGLTAERARAAPITFAVDLGMAALLALSGGIAASTQPLAGMLTIALAVGLALARVVLEPATTAAVFGERTRP